MSEASPTTTRDETLGVLIITRDEQENITRCLDSVAFADQIVVVDSGSTDRTVAIARERGAHVEIREWSGYSAQKQFALSLLSTDWVLWIDADEEVSARLRAEIEQVVRGKGGPDGYRFPRMVRYLGRWMRHSGWYPDLKLRLFRRTRARFDERLVHEGVELDGVAGRLQGALHHYPYRDLRHHARKSDRYARLLAEQSHRDGRRFTLFDELLRPPAMFVRMWILKLGCLDGWQGLVAAVMGARYVWLKSRYGRRGLVGAK